MKRYYFALAALACSFNTFANNAIPKRSWLESQENQIPAKVCQKLVSGNKKKQERCEKYSKQMFGHCKKLFLSKMPERLSYEAQDKWETIFTKCVMGTVFFL